MSAESLGPCPRSACSAYIAGLNATLQVCKWSTLIALASGYVVRYMLNQEQLRDSDTQDQQAAAGCHKLRLTPLSFPQSNASSQKKPHSCRARMGLPIHGGGVRRCCRGRMGSAVSEDIPRVAWQIALLALPSVRCGRSASQRFGRLSSEVSNFRAIFFVCCNVLNGFQLE